MQSRPGPGSHFLSRVQATLELRTFWYWVGLSVLVGIVAGLSAALFEFSLELANKLVLGRLAGWEPPLPHGELHILTPLPQAHLHRFILWSLPAIGGILSGWVIFRYCPEAEGHGTDAMIQAFHRSRGLIRPRVPLVKAIASVATMGFGGSAGREGPITQIGAGFGSILATLLRLPDRERRMLLLAGAAGGLGAIFRIPLGAALFAIEVLYRDGIETEGIFPCVVSSVTAFSVFTMLFGQGHLFETEHSYLFDPRQLPFYALLGLLCAPLGILFIRIFYGMRDRVFARLPLSSAWKPALGGLGLGVLAIGMPHVLGVGYGWVQEALQQTARVPFADRPWLAAGFLLALALAKMLATSLTISSGGSGGVFAPSMVIGGLIGGSVGYALHQVMPNVVPQPGAFVLVGMGCFMAGVSHVPFAAIIMVSEMAGSYDLLVPLMLANAVSFLLLRKHSLYEKQVASPAESPAHVGEFTVDVLEDMAAGNVCDRVAPVRHVAPSMRMREFLRLVATEVPETLFCVSDGQAWPPAGLITLRDVRSILAEDHLSELVVVSDAMTPWKSLAETCNLRDALQAFIESGYTHIPVVSAVQSSQVVGLLSYEDLIAAYQHEILRRRHEGTRHPPTEQLRTYHDERRKRKRK